MDGQILAQSLFALKGDDLRMVFALLCKTNITNIVSSKTMDLLSVDERNHLQKHLLHVENSTKDISDEILQYYLFLEMTKVVGLKGVRYTTEKQIEQQSSIIIDETYKLLVKQEKEKEFINGKSDDRHSKLQQILIYQIDKLLLKLPKVYINFSKEEKLSFVRKLVNFCNVLSEEKQGRLKNQWAVTSIDEELVDTLINTKGLIYVLTILKKAGGFSSYIQLAPEIISFLGPIVPPNPIVSQKWPIHPSNILDLIELNPLLWTMQQNDLQKRLLPIIIMLMCLLYVRGNEEYDFDSSGFIKEWMLRYQKYISLKKNLNEIEYRQTNARNDIEAKNETLKQIETNISNCLKAIEREKETILSELKATDLHNLSINRTFQQYVHELHAMKDKILEMKLAKSAGPDAGSLLKRVGHSITKLYREYNLIEEEKKLDSLYKKMVNEIINVSDSGSLFEKERQSVLVLTRLLNQLNEQKTEEEQNKRRLESKLDSIFKEHTTLSQTILNYEKDNYGLEHLTLFTEDFSKINQDLEVLDKPVEQKNSHWKNKQLFINNYENRITSFEKQYKQALSELETKQLKINLLEQQVKMLEKEMVQLTFYKDKAGALEQKNQDILNQNKKIIEDNTKQTQRFLQENNSSWENKYRDLKNSAETQNKQLWIQNQNWQQKYQNLENEFRERHQSYLKEENDFQTKINHLEELVSKLHQQIEKNGINDSIVEVQKSELIKQKNSYNEMINNLNLNWQKKQDELVQNYDGILAKKSVLINQLRSDRQETEEMLQHHIKVEETNQKLLEQLKDENEKLRKEKTEVEEEWIKKFHEAKAEFEKQLNELTKELEGKKKSKDPLVEEIKVLETVPFPDLF